MSKMVSPAAKACLACGAGNDPGNRICWMCSADVTNAPPVDLAEWATFPKSRSKVLLDWLGTLGVLLGGGIIVGASLFLGSIGAVFFGIVWVAALVIIFSYRPAIQVPFDRTPKANLETGGSNPYAPPLASSSPDNPAGRVAVWEGIREALLILGIVALILIAAFIALGTACYVIIEEFVY